MTSRAAASRFRVITSPWPAVVRAVGGAIAGWLVVRWGVSGPTPSWAEGGATAVVAAGAVVAPTVARSVSPLVVSGWAIATAFGLYLGVPETDHLVEVALALGLILMAGLAGPRHTSWLLVAGLDVVLVWTAVRGAAARGPALVAALAMLGLLVVAPAAAILPGPRAALVPRAAQPIVLIGLQGVLAVVLARQAAPRDTIAVATTISVAGLVGVVAAARLTVGLRPPSH